MNRNQRAAARQLSLAAYLLFGGGKARDEVEIRGNLPAYAEVFDRSLRESEGDDDRARDALRKVLERDVGALADVGIRVEVAGEADGRRYGLPPGGFSPLELDLTDDEKTVLVGALRALRRDFPYARPLHLAVANLVGAASARPDGDGAVDDGNLALSAALATRDDEGISRSVARLESAVTRRKSVRFPYYSISGDETTERTVDPYALSLLDGTWYVTGRDRDRDDLRQYRVSRIRGRVTFATRRDADDFETPEDFERRVAGPRAPWQLGEPVGQATVRVPAAVAEGARARYPQAFAPAVADGEDALRTDFSGERQLAGWVLSLGPEARVLSPPSLVGRVREGLLRLAAAHRETP